MNLILLGAPGAGKGTQTPLLTQRYGIPAIATGEMLRAERQAGTDLGRQVAPYMDRGELAPDELLIKIVRRRLLQPDARRGFLLDGFPRTLVQAKALDAMLGEISREIDVVIHLEVRRQVLIDRLSHRYVCRTCGAVYTFTSAQARHTHCLRDGGELHQRADDRPEIVANRIDIFLNQTVPLIEYYRAQGKLEAVNGELPVEEVRRAILRRLAALEPASQSS